MRKSIQRTLAGTGKRLTLELGGYKESGFGREGGKQGLLDYAKLV